MMVALPVQLHSPTVCHRTVAEQLHDYKLSPHMHKDDILTQGSCEEEVQQMLVMDHMKHKGSEIHPTKIQGQSQQVKLLGIHWHFGK